MLSIDYASLLHFFNFIIIGIFFKDNYIFAFILGVLWEIFEYYLIKQSKVRKFLLNYFKNLESLWNEDIYNKITDIIINMIGYTIGSKISIYYHSQNYPK